MINVNKFQLLLANGDIEKAISGLIHDFNLHLTEDSSIAVEEMYNTVIQLSCRLNTVAQKQNLGTIAPDILFIERNKLSHELLEFLAHVNASKSAFLEKKKIISEEIESDTDLGFDFFLSFSSKDIDQVKKISSTLRKEGFTVFASNDSLKSSVGKSYFDSIDFALHNSRNFLLFSTPNSSQSEWVKTEWRAYFNDVYSTSPGERKIFVYRGQGFEKVKLHFILKQFQNTDRIEDIVKVLKPLSAITIKVPPLVDPNINTKPSEPTVPVEPKGSKPEQKPKPKPKPKLKPKKTPNGLSEDQKILARISVAVLVVLAVSSYFLLGGNSDYDDKTSDSNEIHSLLPSEPSTPSDAIDVKPPPEESARGGNTSTTSTGTTIQDITTSIKVANPTLNFETIIEGKTETRTVSFTNTGKKPLDIKHVEISCNCATVSAITKEVAPGQKGEISIKLKANNQPGDYKGRVAITANTNPTRSFINFTGKVIKEPTTSQPTIASPTGPLTTIKFKSHEIKFGTIDEGEMVRSTFNFTNTGSEPLVISDVKSSCGCVAITSKPNGSIAPGGVGKISVQFNSKNKKGNRNQKVTITANTSPPQSFIYLTGIVNEGTTSKPSKSNKR